MEYLFFGSPLFPPILVRGSSIWIALIFPKASDSAIIRTVLRSDFTQLSGGCT